MFLTKKNKMETIPVIKQNAIKAFKDADAKGRELLQNLLGKENLSMDIRDRVKTFLDACVEIGENPNQDKYRIGADDEIAAEELKIIVKALNEGKKLGSKRWHPWFWNDGAGFRFDAAYCDVVVADSVAGARFALVEEPLAVYAGKQFLSHYKRIHTTTEF